MNSFGDNLRREREAKGISLADVAAQTKIGVRQLKAIEDERLDLLPGGIFTKSFVRQYARFLRVDEESVIADYLKLAGISPEPEFPSTSPVNTMSSHGFAKDSESFSFSMLPSLEDSAPSLLPRIILALICVGVLVGGIFFGVHAWKSRAARSHALASTRTETTLPAQQVVTPITSTGQVDSSDTTGVATPAVTGSNGASGNLAEGPIAPTGTQATGLIPGQSLRGPATSPQQVPATAAPGNASTAKTGVELLINANRECWLSITSDGEKQFQGNLKAGESKRVDAKESVKLTLGDAGAVTMTMNGQQLPPAGHSGEVKTITVSAKNVSQQTP